MQHQFCYFVYLIVMLSFMSCSILKSNKNEQISERKSLNTIEQRQFDYFFYEAIRLKENGQLDEAIENFLMSFYLNPLDAEVQSQLGLLYNNAGLPNEAIQFMENAVNLQSNNWWYNMTLINMYSQQKKWENAIQLATVVQKKYPQKEDIYNVLSFLYKQTGNIGKAINTYNQLENLVGVHEAISFEKIKLYFQLNKDKKALSEIDRLIDKFPSESRYQVLKGDLFLQTDQLEKAYQIYMKVMQDDPQNPYVYVSLSDYYKKINQPEKSLEAIVNALKSDQLDVDSKISILGQYMNQLIQDKEKLDEMDNLFKLLVERYPLEEQVHAYYALFLEYQKRSDEAISELETMLNINPKNEQTWLQLIHIYWDQKNYEKIAEVAERAMKELPENPQFYFYQGIAQFQLENYRLALKSLQLALTLIPDNNIQQKLKCDIYSQIGDTYYKLSKKDSAFIAYEEALKADPENIYVMNNYAYYLALEKENLSKAERMSAKTVELQPRNSTFLDTYAWVLFQEKNCSLAKFYIERAIDNLEKEQENGVIYEHYGDILWECDFDKEKAVEMWKKALEEGNHSEELQQKIQKALSAMPENEQK
ncbi:MAG TPA: tetratricopeptide repeat protein [Paludibacteraceae bacterium]|nr:tetratricopeptide repeat protein [Paludibacteraceae bacterium]HPO66754.1 tetratricopeptide repeat protein [Paludibacteraceae bacterium]